MKIHNLKILNNFADAVVAGDKTFEIRKNDRGYQKGDYIIFQAVDEKETKNPHAINERAYRITYVLNGWGLKKGYVALGIKESAAIQYAAPKDTGNRDNTRQRKERCLILQKRKRKNIFGKQKSFLRQQD